MEGKQVATDGVEACPQVGIHLPFHGVGAVEGRAAFSVEADDVPFTSFRVQRSVLRLPSPRKVTLSPSILIILCRTNTPLNVSANTASPTCMSSAFFMSALSRPSSKNGRMLLPLSFSVTVWPSSRIFDISGRNSELRNCISLILLFWLHISLLILCRADSVGCICPWSL